MLLSMLYTDVLQGERIRALRVEDFDRLADSGAFGDDERVELLHGMLVVMDVPGGPHIWITQRLMERLVLATVGTQLKVICQSAVKMGDYQLPQPDLAIVPKQVGFARPVGGLLVIEVADTSLRKDKDVKPAIYAQANVPEYWLVDVRRECVVVHRDPHGMQYRMIELIPRTGTLQPMTLPGVEIVVDDLFRPGD